jgi:hypothetical protein
MKITLRLFAVLFLCFSSWTAFSQAICGFDNMHARRMADPAYRKAIRASEENLRQYIDNHPGQSSARGSLGPYTIPVVIHIVHTGGAIGSIYNPTDAQVSGAIDYLNQVYNGTYPGTTSGDLQIQFALAKRDPNCNPTNGINRVNGSGIPGYVAGGVNSSTTSGTDELNVKNLIRWPVADYYNIWVVDKIDAKDGTSGQFVAGFAYFPSINPAAAQYDGIIMLATQMKTGQKTLPHEIGHAFNLYHPFEGSPDKTTCPGPVCGSDGDQVCDTDPITYNQTGGVIDFTCRTGTNTCTGTPYSPNTENNYMNYTNCFNLFTPGQNARMLASAAAAPRASLTTSLGATPTTSATNPCAPKIDFEFSEGQATEATATTTGCRSYTDYTYNMVIGNDPSTAATALLTASGTATEGVDFDVTTNGNFTAPSKTLNFPAGSHAAQPFTIRIYDDASVESPETVTLNFTVNNGGGTAVKGDGRTVLVFTIADNDAAPYGSVISTKTIGGYTTNIGIAGAPFSGPNASQKSELLYKKSELNAAGMINAGNITGLGLNLIKNTAPGFVFQGLTIKMGLTAVTGFAPQNDAGYTTVYNGNYSTINGLNNFVFSTPFAWDGISNIVVVICYDNGATTSPSIDVSQGYSDGGAGFTDIFQAGINCAASYTGASAFTAGTKPNIQFTYSDPGTALQTVLNTSRQEYLGPGADVYFYDQATGKLMARIANGSAFDYGCTQVTIDRNNTSAGANSVAFWNNNPANYLLSRTLKVTPTTNNPSGSYQISLYYTPAEVTAWQTASGQTINNAQLIKVSTQISDVTPANPTGGGTVNIVTPVVSTLGSNTVLTGSFSSGFSGFGAGVAGVALPVKLLDFTGSLNGNAIVLKWSTSSESNSKNFEVERSGDGISFSKIGVVAAAGNSSINRYYAFNDPSIVTDNNYYRLKQVDLDNKYEYSKVILVKNTVATNFRVINNPFHNQIDVDFGKAQSGKAEITLMDVAGKEIYRSVSDLSSQSKFSIYFDGRNISAGIYMLKIKTLTGQFTARVIKQ